MNDIRPGIDRATAVIGVLLIVVAGVIAWDARALSSRTVYGIGPEMVPYMIAGGLAVLGIGHLVSAARNVGTPRVEAADLLPMVWIVGGFVAMMALVAYGGGFVLGMAVLFTATAYAFGRRALLTDFAIGLTVGLVCYLGFTRLLTLSLPQGPLERLL